MQRYDTRIDDGTLYIEVGEEDMEMGSMDDVCEILGGETYTLEYDEKAQAAGWLQTEDDGTITFDVRETIDDVDYNETFVEKMAEEPLDRETPDGYPVRTAAFADLMAEIWDSKGSYELD
jgi:DNA-dependent RNA polymerase auxiliary subunit epsilon